VLLTVDAARLAKAHELGLFCPYARRYWRHAFRRIFAPRTGFPFRPAPGSLFITRTASRPTACATTRIWPDRP
jgi:hypothetical protein